MNATQKNAYNVALALALPALGKCAQEFTRGYDLIRSAAQDAMKELIKVAKEIGKSEKSVVKDVKAGLVKEYGIDKKALNAVMLELGYRERAQRSDSGSGAEFDEAVIKTGAEFLSTLVDEDDVAKLAREIAKHIVALKKASK